MEYWSHYFVIVINTIFCVRYCILTISKKIKPSLAMWLFFTIAVTGSLFSYLLESNYTVWDNILNSSDLILCAVITTVILMFGAKESRMDRFDLLCLTVVVLILLFWLLSKAHFSTHISLQIIQLIAYIPVIRKMIKSGENTESFFAWILLLLVSAISLFSAKGILAVVYSLRATICVAILLIIMSVLEFRSRLVSSDLKPTEC